MRDENPAAIPLTALVAGLLLANIRLDLAAGATAFVAVALLAGIARWRRIAIASLFIALGIFVGTGRRTAEETAHRTIRELTDERFVTVTAEIDRGWTQRGSASMLRVESFTIAGRAFDEPLRIYVRFDPPPTGTSARVVAEGFVRRGARGVTMNVKSPRLLRFEGEIDRRSPKAWNRLASLRSAAFAPLYPEAVALAEAIVLGRGERLSDEMHENFREGGTYHLLVFSGLQISFAAAVFGYVLRWLRAPRISDWLLLTFAGLAPLFIGGTPSVTRASIAIGLYAVSRIAGRPTSFENLWCLSALARLIAAPEDLFDAGFHLTYAGAGALLFLARPFATGRASWIVYAIAAETVLAPITLFYFHQFALGGSIATLAMTPLIFVILLLSVAFFASGQEFVLVLIEWLHHLCVRLNDAGATTSGFFAAPPLVTIAIAAVVSLVSMCFLRGRRRAAVIAIAFLVPTAGAIHRHLAQRSVEGIQLSMLDVGQGDAMLLREGKTTMLIDGGGRNEDLRFGESTLLPMLVDRGVTRIDAVVLTHAHPDHCGGLPAVLEELSVAELWVSPRRFRGDCTTRLLEAARQQRVPIRLLAQNRTVVVGRMVVSTLLPTRTFRRAPENNASVTLRIRGERRTILLTGDIEREAELDLLDQDLRADILKVPHHGSRTSTIPWFLDAVTPRVALISAGRENLFGHPHPELLGRLTEKRIRVWRSDRNGTVTTTIRNGRIAVSTEIDTPR